MKITRRDVPTSHIKVIKRYFSSPSRSQPDEYFHARFRHGQQPEPHVSRRRAYMRLRTHESRARSITLSLLNNNTMRDRSATLACTRAYVLPASRLLPAPRSSLHLFPLRSLTFLPRSRLFLLRPPGEFVCFNVATRRV